MTLAIGYLQHWGLPKNTNSHPPKHLKDITNSEMEQRISANISEHPSNARAPIFCSAQFQHNASIQSCGVVCKFSKTLNLCHYDLSPLNMLLIFGDVFRIKLSLKTYELRERFIKKKQKKKLTFHHFRLTRTPKLTFV